jgi:F-type H+-transporting ATPase subunit b
MSLDLWGLGLQAANVLILVWLMQRVFWRPVAAAIAKRQDTVNAITQSAEATKAKAEAALAEATQARDGIAAERVKTLNAAKVEAETAAKATLTEARTKAETLLADAKAEIEKSAAAARKANAKEASDLSLVIAARLLDRLNGPAVQSAFLSQLVDAIVNLPAAERAALTDTPDGIEVATAKDAGASRTEIEQAIQSAFKAKPKLRFVTDPDLIGGIELRGPHFSLRNSWQADLSTIRKGLTDAG